MTAKKDGYVVIFTKSKVNIAERITSTSTSIPVFVLTYPAASKATLERRKTGEKLNRTSGAGADYLFGQVQYSQPLRALAHDLRESRSYTTCN